MEHERAIQNLAVESYLLGEMSPAERESFEEHYFECAVCAEDLRAAAQFMEDAKDLLADGPSTSVASARSRTREVEAPKQAGWDWLRWLRPQAAAAMIAALVVIIGVETLSTIPGLRRKVDESETPKIVKSIVLRPVTRGDASTVRAGAGEPVVLVFDPPESPELSAGSPLRFMVKAADGHPVFELTGVAPDPGERITLSIPRLNVPPGGYTLVVEGEAGSDKAVQELGQYPFKLEH
jgi:anti-sigma factor RsiW